jgi:tetratricopeptide (TPR) repeat protein
MLFDLRSGKRRRVVQVVFGGLAVIFVVGFLGFGIGGETGGGGILDAVGLGGGNGSGNPQFDEQIEDAEEKLAENPEDERALLELAEVRYQAGQFNLEQDPATGAPVVTPESQENFEASLDAWERYLKLKPDKPYAGVANFAAQAYVQLGDAEGAAEAQRLVAEDNPSGGTYANLAYYLYASGDIEAGDEAAKRAVAEADESQKKQIRRQLAQISEQAQRLQEQAEKQAEQAGEQGGAGAAPIADPFGSLGGTGGVGGTAPTTPPAP